MDEEKNSVDYWLQRVREAKIELKHVPESMRTEAVCLAAVHKDGWDLKDVPRALQTEHMCRAAVRQNAYVLDIVPRKLKSKVRAALGLP